MPEAFEYGVGTPIEEWWRGGEMMPGSRTVRDYYPAFARALATYERALGEVVPNRRARGFTLLFGPGDYHFSQTPTLIRGMYLLGQGGHGQLAHGTRFRYANGIDGLHTRFQDSSVTPPEPPEPPIPPEYPIGGGQGRSDYSVVENIAFLGNYHLSKDNHGIWALAPIRITNCFISRWGGNGIRMTSAPATPEEIALGAASWSSSTNHSLVEHCTVQECGWRDIIYSDPHHSSGRGWEAYFCDDYFDGIYVEGGNSNGILFSAVHCKSNGRWGFYDESGTGCTFVACMTHGNGIVSEPGVNYPLPDGGSYKVFHPEARSVFIGCYAEYIDNQRIAEVNPLTFVFGGAMSVDRDQGQRFRNDSSRVLHLDAGVSVKNHSRGHEWVMATLGTTRRDGAGGVAFEARNETNALRLNLMYDQTDKNWAWRYEASKYMVIGTTGGTNQLGDAGGVGRGQVLFPQGMLFGQETGNIPQIHLKHALGITGQPSGYIQGIIKTQMVGERETKFFEGYASGPPNPNAPGWNAGDRLWNINPGPGDWIGWVCTTSGTSTTWRGFGAIEPLP